MSTEALLFPTLIYMYIKPRESNYRDGPTGHKTWSLKAGSHNESNDTKRVVNALDCKHNMLHLMLSDATQHEDRI